MTINLNEKSGDELANLICEIDFLIQDGTLSVGVLGLSENAAKFCNKLYKAMSNKTMTKKQEKWEDETLREWRKLWLEVVDLIVNSEGIVDLVEAETITEQFISDQLRQARQREREVIVNKMLKIEKTKWHDCEHCTCLAYAIVSIFGEKYEKIIKGFNKEK